MIGAWGPRVARLTCGRRLPGALPLRPLIMRSSLLRRRALYRRPVAATWRRSRARSSRATARSSPGAWVSTWRRPTWLPKRGQADRVGQRDRLVRDPADEAPQGREGQALRGHGQRHAHVLLDPGARLGSTAPSSPTRSRRPASVWCRCARRAARRSTGATNPTRTSRPPTAARRRGGQPISRTTPTRWGRETATGGLKFWTRQGADGPPLQPDRQLDSTSPR